MRKLSSAAPEVDFDRDDVADDADDFGGVTAPDALPLELNSSNGFTSAEKSLTAALLSTASELQQMDWIF